MKKTKIEDFYLTKDGLVLTEFANGGIAWEIKYTYTYDVGNGLTDITTMIDNVLIKIRVYTYDSNDNHQKTVVNTYTNGTTLELTVTTTMLRRYNLQDE